MSRGKNLFRLEEFRNSLALRGRLHEFEKTYKSGMEPVTDVNSDEFWSRKTFVEKEGLVGSPIYQDKLKIISNYISKIGGRFLDIGFGNAEIEKRLQLTPNLKIYGIDISKRAVSEAKIALNGTYCKASILKIPFKSNYFNIVSALDVLEHVSQDKTLSAYREVARTLKKGGNFIVSVPINEDLERMIKLGINPNGHIRAYTPAIIKGELLISGFRILTIHYLYAFKNMYSFKKTVLRLFPFKYRKPNLMIIVAQKK